MTSTTTRTENGAVVFICGGRRRHPDRCAYCSRPRIATCDFNGTCAASLCGQCARAAGAGRHHCRVHELRGDREADFCRACGARKPPIEGEGTCPACVPNQEKSK